MLPIMVDFHWALYCVLGTIRLFNPHDNEKGPFLITAMFCNKQRHPEMKLFAQVHLGGLAVQSPVTEPLHPTGSPVALVGAGKASGRGAEWMNLELYSKSGEMEGKGGVLCEYI